MTPQTMPITSASLAKLVLLKDIVPSSTQLNSINPEQVERLQRGYENGDPIPPVVVFAIENGKFEIVFGNHRLAARQKRFVDIPAIVLPHRPEPLEILAMQFRENADRHTLTSLERATAFYKAKEQGLNNKQVAILFNVSEGTVSRDLSIDKNLHPTLKDLVAQAKLCPKKAWAASRLDLNTQIAFVDRHAKVKAEDFADLVSEELAKIEGATPKVRPIQVTTPGGLKAMLLPSAEACLSELAKLSKAVKAVSEKGGSLSDIPAWLRLNG